MGGLMLPIILQLVLVGSTEVQNPQKAIYGTSGPSDCFNRIYFDRSIRVYLTFGHCDCGATEGSYATDQWLYQYHVVWPFPAS